MNKMKLTLHCLRRHDVSPFRLCFLATNSVTNSPQCHYYLEPLKSDKHLHLLNNRKDMLVVFVAAVVVFARSLA